MMEPEAVGPEELCRRDEAWSHRRRPPGAWRGLRCQAWGRSGGLMSQVPPLQPPRPCSCAEEEEGGGREPVKSRLAADSARGQNLHLQPALVSNWRSLFSAPLWQGQTASPVRRSCAL